MIHFYDANETGRDFVVGDIHGYYTILMKALEDIDFDFENDRLFSCGDLVDRGPENHRVLKLTQEPWFIPVRGNHEDMLFEGMLMYNTYSWQWEKNTGRWARREGYKEWGMQMTELKALVRKLKEEIPLAIQINHKNGKRYGIVHAAVPDMDWERVLTRPDFAVWDRQILYHGMIAPVDNIDYVFHGHSYIGTEGPRRIANRIYLDSSVYSTGLLNIHEIGTEEALVENLLEKYKDML